MILKIFLFLMGILIKSLSLMFIIMYLNLINMGFTLLDYLYFIITRFECLMIIIGIILIIISMYKRKDSNNDIYL